MYLVRSLFLNVLISLFVYSSSMSYLFISFVFLYAVRSFCSDFFSSVVRSLCMSFVSSLVVSLFLSVI